MSKFHVFKDEKGEFRWRFTANNGKILADSGEGYVKKSDCEHGIDLLKTDAANAPIQDESDTR